MFFILNGWLTGFSEWVILFHLVEKAQEQFDEEEARELQKKIAKNKFDFEDFLAADSADKKNGKHERPDRNDSRSRKSDERY